MKVLIFLIKAVFINFFLVSVVSGNANATDELNPSDILKLLSKDIPRIEHYKQKSIRRGLHLAIHLNCKLINF